MHQALATIVATAVVVASTSSVGGSMLKPWSSTSRAASGGGVHSSSLGGRSIAGVAGSSSSPVLPPGYGLNARDFGAAGDSATDDTDALQRAIDASQLHGRELFIPAGGYLVHRQLNFSCASPASGCAVLHCCDCAGGINGGCSAASTSCCTHTPVKLRGEGYGRTSLIAASPMNAVLDFGGRLNVGEAAKAWGQYNYSSEHQVTDLHVQCNHRNAYNADFGLHLPGTHHIIMARLRVDNAKRAGLYTYFSFLTHVESSRFYGNRIGIHSGSTNLRVIASDFASNDIACILIDAGNAIEIDNCVMEGNSGTPIIISGGRQGAPFAVAVTNNYFEENNIRPLWWRIGRRPRAQPIQLCSELLINGNVWNDSVSVGIRSPPWDKPVGDVGNLYPAGGITFTGNQISGPTANNPVTGEPTPCKSYAAVTAVAATAVRIATNTLAMGVHKWKAGPGWPGNTTRMQPDMTASVLRLGTDTVVWAATNIEFSANTAVSPWPNTPTDTPYYGFSPLVELIDADASFGVDGGEVPLHSMESSEVPQRNFYRPRSMGDTIIWPASELSAELAKLEPHRVDDYDARDTVIVHADGKAGGAIVASFDLSKSSLGGNPAYIAVDVLLEPPSAHLTLMIDNGSGKWQYSNATRGVACKRDLGITCTELQSGQRDPAHALDPDKFVTRSYQALMQANGTARFGLILTPPSVGKSNATLAGMAIAPIGARWHSLKTDDESNDATQERATIDQHELSSAAVAGLLPALEPVISMWHDTTGFAMRIDVVVSPAADKHATHPPVKTDDLVHTKTASTFRAAVVLLVLPLLAPAQHDQHLTYFDQNIIVMEAENFTSAGGTAGGSWEPKPWMLSANRFASSVADTYLSRRAYLQGRPDLDAAVTASMDFEVATEEAGTFEVLLRYEAAFRFETPVLLTIATQGAGTGARAAPPLFSRVYGQRSSLKVYPFGGARLGPFGNGTGASMCGPGRPLVDLQQAECWFPYGSSEQNVWEGVGTKLHLAAGSYTATFTASNDTGVDYPAGMLEFADRNVDVLVLTHNSSDVDMRLKYPPMVLPLDGLLTQGDEVFFKVTNENTTHTLNLTIPFVMGHSIYWDTHLRLPVKTGVAANPVISGCNHLGAGPICPVISVAPNSTSDFVDVGGLMDVFQHGTWYFQAGNYSIEVGVKPRHTAAIESINKHFRSGGHKFEMLFDQSTRASKRMRAQTEDVMELAAALDKQTETMVPGRLPNSIPTFGVFFDKQAMVGTELATCPHCGAEYEETVARLDGMFHLLPIEGAVGNMWNQDAVNDATPNGTAFGYMVEAAAGWSLAAMEAHLKTMNESTRAKIKVVTLGDEIPIAGGDISNASFAAWCQRRELSAAAVGCVGWDGCAPAILPKGNGNVKQPMQPIPPLSAELPARLFFYNWALFLHDKGIEHFKNMTSHMRQWLPNAGFGANFTPYGFFIDPRDGQNYCFGYIGETFQWIRSFKEGGLSLPWSEDWQWQTPLGSQQMETMMLDVQRAAMTTYDSELIDPAAPYIPRSEGHQYVPVAKPSLGPEGRPPQLMYIMTENPGENPVNWRRQLYGDLGHGLKMIDLFEFHTVQAQQTTCDYTDPYQGNYQAVRVGLNELGMMDDIIATGVAQPFAMAAILWSECSDIWLATVGTVSAAKRSLYIALRHAGIPIDIVIDSDIEKGALNHFSAMYIVDPLVTESAMNLTTQWVRSGGQLVLTAGAALLNETNQTSQAAAALLDGITQAGLYTGTRFSRWNASITFIKEDLPWAETLDHVTPTAAGTPGQPLDVLGQKAILVLDKTNDDDDHAVLAKFDDGSPAELSFKRGAGSVLLLAYHPGFSYFAGALPRRPSDRNAHPDAFTNLIPTNFSTRARDVLVAPLEGVHGAVPVQCSEPLVEASLVISSSQGAAVITLVNWAQKIDRAHARPSLRVTVELMVELGFAAKAATLASCGVLDMSQCSPEGSRLNATGGTGAGPRPGGLRSFSVDLAIADAIILR